MKIRVPPHSGKPVDYEQRQALIKAARQYLGVPWQHMGRNTHGLDCAGELILPVHDVLRCWIEVSDYSAWPSPHIMREICNQILFRINPRDLQPGDVALLYVHDLGVCHMGWFAGRTLIHASNEANVQKVIENTIHPDWNLRGAYSVPQFIGERFGCPNPGRY